MTNIYRSMTVLGGHLDWIEKIPMCLMMHKYFVPSRFILLRLAARREVCRFVYTDHSLYYTFNDRTGWLGVDLFRDDS